MDASDRKQFVRIITGLADVYGRELSPFALEVYWETLAELPIDAIDRAAMSCAKGGRFMPTPADLRAAAGIASPKDRAQLAWETVRRHIGRIGGYASVDFEDRATNATIRGLGGWVNLTARETEELDTYTRHAFLQAYPAWAGRSAGEAGDHLPGIMEQTEGGRAMLVTVPCEYLPAPRKEIEA